MTNVSIEMVKPQADVMAMFNGTLTKCAILSACFDNMGKLMHYVVRFDGDNEDKYLGKKTKFYNSENDFRNDARIAEETEVLDVVSYHPYDGLAPIGIECWTMQDGEPVQTRLEIEGIVRTKELFDPQTEIILKDNLKYDNKVYAHTREECLAWNDYKVRLDDGTEVVRRGIAKKLALTEEQMKLKNELESLLDRMGKAGIRIFMDSWEDSMHVANMQEIDNLYSTEEGCQDDDEIEVDERYLTRVKTDFYNDSCDYHFYYKEKENK